MLSKSSQKSLQNVLNIQHRKIHTKFAIVGGGTAGMNVAAQLLSSKVATSPSEITVFEPRKTHYYQPGFTMVAGGVLGDNDSELRSKLGGLIQKPMSQIFDPSHLCTHNPYYLYQIRYHLQYILSYHLW